MNIPACCRECEVRGRMKPECGHCAAIWFPDEWLDIGLYGPDVPEGMAE